MKKVHPWSSLHYGLPAFELVRKLYLEWIPKYFGEKTEIQILSPMTRGSLGTVSLNKMIQESANPARKGKGRPVVGERVFRVGAQQKFHLTKKGLALQAKIQSALGKRLFLVSCFF